jgi:PST family polysaccharide transporter
MWVHVVQFARKWADSFVIGIFLGPVALGYYTVSRQLVNGVSSFITESVGPVVWSTLSRLQKQPERMRRAIYQAAEMTAVIAWPAFLGIATLAPELVSTLLGERWMVGVPVVRAFALLAGAEIFNVASGTAIAAAGESRWRLRLEGLVAAVSLAAIAVALPHGIVAVARAFAGSLFVLLPVQLWVAVRLLPIDLGGYLRQFLYPIMGSVFMALVVVAFRQSIGRVLGGPPLLVVLIITGALVYFGFMMLLQAATVRRAFSNVRIAIRRVREGESGEPRLPDLNLST